MGLPWIRGYVDHRALYESWNVTFAAIWLGLMLVGWLFYVATLLLPLSGWLVALVWLLVLVASLTAQRAELAGDRVRALRRSALPLPIVFLGIALVLAERSTWIGNLEDTGGYHWNIIQWLNQFGVVPGLGLFQARLATSSSWLALTASLNAGPLEERVLGAVNGGLFLISVAWFVVASLRIAKGSRAQSDWFLAAGLVFLLPKMLRWEMRLSPSPDVPVLIAPFVMCWLLMRAEETSAWGAHASGRLRSEVVWVLFAALAVTIKLNAVPLLIVALAASMMQARSLLDAVRGALLTGLLTVLILLPLFATSLITSGCVLFPNAFTCFEWPIGIGSAAASDLTAIVRNTAPWDIAGLLWMSLAAFLLIVLNVRSLSPAAVWTVALALVAIAFLLAFAPTSRFGRGYLLLLPALAFAVHRQRIANWSARIAARWTRTTKLAVAFTLVLIFSVPLYKDLPFRNREREDASINAPNTHRWLIPNRLDFRGSFTMARSGSFEYAISREGTCWNHPIPCASNTGKPFMHELQLRNPERGLAGGFSRLDLPVSSLQRH